MSEPKRIQRKRIKGWRMPEGAVYVGRGTQWGNPYRVGGESAFIGSDPVMNLDEEPLTARDVTDLFRAALNRDQLSVTVDQVRDLRGRDLACWCPLDQPCHADVLLEVANS